MQLLIYLLPFTLLLACPLLMVLMMRGMHGGHGGHGGQSASGASDAHATGGEAGAPIAPDPGARLQAMEQEIAALRRELAGGGRREASWPSDGVGG